jgi:hypothetical protein
LSKNIRHLAHLDIPGGGQIVVSGNCGYIGHMRPPHGTSIIDVSDPAQPRVLSRLEISPLSHSHKVRVVGDIMISNVEQDRRHQLRKAGLGQDYNEGGFKVWDVSNPATPKLISYQHTFGFGVHRFDMDQRYAYISTEMEGYLGNILVIYDIANPEQIEEVSRWSLPGQHIAAGETPEWSGYSHRLHHAMRVGDQLWAAVWHAGFRVIDISDISQPKTQAGYTYHPWIVEPTHTILPATQSLGGRRVAVVCDEEHEHRHGQPHAGLWLFDVSDLDTIQPLSTFHVSELDSPWARAPGRFGMHQFCEHIDDHLVYCAWFSGGLRVVDISDPTQPLEHAFFIPEPASDQASPQSNDVDVDARGLIYLLDRNRGLDILELQ